MIATGLLWLLLFALSAADNTFHFTSAKYADWQIDFMNWSFLGIQAPVVVMLTFAILFCLYRSNWAGSARLDGEGRKSSTSGWRNRAGLNSCSISAWRKVNWRTSR